MVIMVSLVKASKWWPSGLNRSSVGREMLARQRKKMIGVAQWLPKLAREQGKHMGRGGLIWGTAAAQ